MRKSFFSRFANWAVYIFLTVVLAGIVAASTVLINYLRKEEIHRIKVFASAQKFLNDQYMGDPRVQELILSIIQDNNSIPVVVADRFNNPLYWRNIPQSIEQDPQKLKALPAEMEKSYAPIEVVMPSGQNQYIYYTNSRLLNNLRYYPFLLGLIFAAYIAFSFWFLKTIKKTDEGFLWAGLAKETAHQIGTPLSSMIGWVEILKMENAQSAAAVEIERDIDRLKTISERFSKIGSVPELSDRDFGETVRENYEYLRKRISSKVDFSLTVPDEKVIVPHSRVLMSWVIENLVKNAVDAMRGEGKMEMKLFRRGHHVLLDICDNGSGMSRRQMRNAFKPGFSTKKRGWGLGLSLARRAINEYHSGDLRIVNSEPGKGTTFRIDLKYPQA
ncbi:MAG: sensor histidine kinase [Chryseobacterium sp.]|nr:MAG: sensor histidine kinase [Chryseobacterium sp.]